MRSSLLLLAVSAVSCTPPAPISSLAVGDDVSCVIAGNRILCWGDGDPAPQNQILGNAAVELVIGSSMRCVREAARDLDGGVDTGPRPDVGGLDAGPMDAGPLVDAGPPPGSDAGPTPMGANIWRCWGQNTGGQFGVSSPTTSQNPVLVPFSGETLRVARFEGSFACGVNGGAVSCWGTADRGQLGPGALGDTFLATLVPLPGPASVIALGVGRDHACAATTTGVWCWGAGTEGQLGNLDRRDSALPIQVPLTEEFTSALGRGSVSLALGERHTCAQAGSLVRCWGADELGQLGQSTRNTPLGVYSVEAAGRVVAGANHTCAVEGTTVQCWGDNGQSQLGSPAPTPMGTITVDADGSAGVGLGVAHSCALAGGMVQCWGSVSQGQLGTGAVLETFVPTVVIGLQ